MFSFFFKQTKSTNTDTDNNIIITFSIHRCVVCIKYVCMDGWMDRWMDG